jgi:proteasome beta subunit
MRKENFLNSFKLPPSRKADIKIIDLVKDMQKKITKQNIIKTGTTTVGLICKDAVILGTDRRASMAYFVASKTAKKLHKIQNHLYMTIAGGVADAQYLIDIIKAETTIYQLEKERPIPVKSAARILSNVLYKNKLFPYQVGLILGGITEEEGAILLDIGTYGSILPDDYIAVGSGTPFAIGVLEANYKKNLLPEEGKNICINAVKSALIRDMASGNGIDIAIIKKDGTSSEEFIPIK